MLPKGMKIESRSTLVHNGNNQFFQRKHLGRVPLMSLQPPQGQEVSRVCRYPFNLNISASFRRRQRWKPLTRISIGSPNGALRTTWKGTPGTSPHRQQFAPIRCASLGESHHVTSVTGFKVWESRLHSSVFWVKMLMLKPVETFYFGVFVL